MSGDGHRAAAKPDDRGACHAAARRSLASRQLSASLHEMAHSQRRDDRQPNLCTWAKMGRCHQARLPRWARKQRLDQHVPARRAAIDRGRMPRWRGWHRSGNVLRSWPTGGIRQVDAVAYALERHVEFQAPHLPSHPVPVDGKVAHRTSGRGRGSRPPATRSIRSR